MRILLSLVVLISCVLGSTSSAGAAELSKADLAFFETKIRPVLVKHCYQCHSADSKDPKGGLLLDTRDGIRRGGEMGHGVVPGNLDESLVISALRYESVEMPPNAPLPANVIANFEKWVQMGAPDPRAGKSSVQRKINFEEARAYWAYQPIEPVSPPATQNRAWPLTTIDQFVLARLESHDLTPAAAARPETLIRRVTIDLIGLPPTPEQVDAFVEDCAQLRQADEAIPVAAMERLVDQLLESPHFGERWGRHWLDVARFGESTGMERNYTFPQAWRYRDYVIAAFNADKPYDEFITEQIAGDLLESQSPSERLKNLVATGFLAIGPKSLNERNREQFAMDIVDDQIDVTTRAFLGLTVACARCHDHKFDAVPQAEYYALAGIFRSTDTFYGTGGGNGNRQSGQLLTLRDGQIGKVSANGGNKNKANANKIKQLTKQIRNFENQLKRAQSAGNAAAKIQKLEKQIAASKKRLSDTRRQMEAETKAKSTKPDAVIMGVQDSAKTDDTQIRVRGEPDDRGDTVPRGFLTVASFHGKVPSPLQGSGRLELARWITSEPNPLTARVAVNRIWQHLFGRGLVASVNNFGNNGDRPSHPQLLDHLAISFRENGWSTKQMIRQIVTSRVYQQACQSPTDISDVDPENRFLSRQNQRRLEAESIRDAMLVASGQIDLAPATSSVVAKIGNGDVGRGISPDKFETLSNKRSVYLPIVRSAVPETLRIFDFPEPSIIAAQRDVTTVPTQALYMLNSPFVLSQAKALAARVRSIEDSTTGRVTHAVRFTFCRNPSDSEVARMKQFLNDAEDQEQAWEALCQVLLASAEFRYLQ